MEEQKQQQQQNLPTTAAPESEEKPGPVQNPPAPSHSGPPNGSNFGSTPQFPPGQQGHFSPQTNPPQHPIPSQSVPMPPRPPFQVSS